MWEPEPTGSIAGMGEGGQGTWDAVEGLCDLEGGLIWHLCNVFPTHNVSSLCSSRAYSVPFAFEEDVTFLPWYLEKERARSRKQPCKLQAAVSRGLRQPPLRKPSALTHSLAEPLLSVQETTSLCGSHEKIWPNL